MIAGPFEESIRGPYGSFQAHDLGRIESGGSDTPNLPIVPVCEAGERVERGPDHVIEIDDDTDVGEVQNLYVEVVPFQGPGYFTSGRLLDGSGIGSLAAP
jgi:hypothetical protein